MLISPAEIAKVRLQIQKEPHSLIGSSHPFDFRPKYQGSLHCLRTIVKEEGLAGLYKGSLALLGRDCHSCGAYFLTYSVLCDWLTPAGKNKPGMCIKWESSVSEALDVCLACCVMTAWHVFIFTLHNFCHPVVYKLFKATLRILQVEYFHLLNKGCLPSDVCQNLHGHAFLH